MKKIVRTTRGASKHSHARQRSQRRVATTVKGWQKRGMKVTRATRRIDQEEKRGHENIKYMLDFLASADIYALRNAGTDNLRRLQRMLEAYHDDAAFDAEFPEKSINSFQNEKGKALPSTDGDRRAYFRQRTLLLCAGKLYDMMMGSSFMKTPSYAPSGDMPASYEKVFKTAVSIAHPERTANAFQHVTVRPPKVGGYAYAASV